MTETPEDNALTILERLREGGLWQPAGLGLSYIRTGEKSISLITQENNPTSAQARIRMRLLIEGVGWQVDESEAQLTDVQHLSPQQQHMQEMMMRQEMAQNWKCNCGTPLSAFPLEEARWNFDGQEEMILPTGEKELVEQWSVITQCPVCEAIVPLEPYDYGLLAGDDAMTTYSFRTSIPESRQPSIGHVENKYTLTALSRPEIIAFMDMNNGDADGDAPEMFVTGTFYNGHMLPPHVRGAVVSVTKWIIATGEEE